MKRLWNWHIIGISVHYCTFLTGCIAPTVSYPIGTVGSFPEVKRPWHGPSFLSSALIKNG